MSIARNQVGTGWFYHANEDQQVKSAEQLFQLYLKSVGRGANLLLNVPPDSRGLIHSNDSAALVAFQKMREESFADNLLRQAALAIDVHCSQSSWDGLKMFSASLPSPHSFPVNVFGPK